MKKIENELEVKCCRFARDCGFAALKIEKNKHKGVPDRLFIGDERVLFVEFKKKGQGIVSKEQTYWKNFLQDNKVESYIMDDYQEFKLMILQIH